MEFSHAITRKPGPEMVDGITTANLGIPVFGIAQQQHDKYIKALEECGVTVTVLEPDTRFPDGMFVEDTAVLAKGCAVLTNPGAETRKGEEEVIHSILTDFFDTINSIEPPGTLEGGDVMQVEDHFYIGLSERTNQQGVDQFIRYLSENGYTGTSVTMEYMLHLKTGVAYLGNGKMLTAGEFHNKREFEKFEKIAVAADEMYAANCIRVNDFVIVPEGFPKTLHAIETAGFKTKTVNVSEYQKLDGGLSCLSLRF